VYEYGENFHVFHSSPNISAIMKSRVVLLTVYVATQSV